MQTQSITQSVTNKNTFSNFLPAAPSQPEPVQHTPIQVKQIQNKGILQGVIATAVSKEVFKYLRKYSQSSIFKAMLLKPEDDTKVYEAFKNNMKSNGLEDLKINFIQPRFVKDADGKKKRSLYKEFVQAYNKAPNNEKLKVCEEYLKRELVLPQNKAAFDEIVDTHVKEIQNSFVGKLDRLIQKFLTEEQKRIAEAKLILRIRTLQYRNFKNIEYGTNAYSLPAIKKIFLPAYNLRFTAAHEAGHFKFYMTKAGKVVNRLIPMKLLPAGIILASVLTRTKKQTKDKKLNVTDKTMNFIRKNAAILTFACFLPNLINEGAASIKGLNMVKKHLPKVLNKRFAKSMSLAWLTYLTEAAAFAGTALVGVKVKDYFQNKYEQTLR